MKVMASLLLIFMLTACETIKYVDRPVYYQREALGITPPESLDLGEVSVILVVPENGQPYFKLDSDSYKNLILNNKQVEGYIREANERILQCEAYYTAPLDEANKQ